MRLLHYSRGPIALAALTDKGQTPPIHHVYTKPIGLWVSVEGEHDWKSWCRDDGGLTMLGEYEHEVTLTDNAQIKRVSSACELDEFTEEYGIVVEIPGLPEDSRKYWRERKAIDWLTLEEQYDGIIIAPYIWERRLSNHTTWYYGWDCASGCIWRPSKAVADVKLLGKWTMEVA